MKEINMIPDNCPSCGGTLEFNETGVDLFCRSMSCGAQVERKLLHFFGTLSNLDGLGIKTIENLVDNGFDTIPKIYSMKYNDFEDCGYKHKTIFNLGSELESSLQRPIPDYRFLAALGISHLGIGSAKKFLEEYDIMDIFLVDREALSNIDGFGNIKSEEIFSEMNHRHSEIRDIFNLNFNIVKETIEVTESPFTDKRLTFSGKMSGNRKEMENHAKSLGAIITGVNSKSDYLIIGENVGSNKMNAAEKFGITILTEKEYMEKIDD